VRSATQNLPFFYSSTDRIIDKEGVVFILLCLKRMDKEKDREAFVEID